ncbi:MAG: dUTP diphosphatase [Sphingomonas sp.]|nr:dUTP diphosphatase [Sphingomonas sp.]|tara:strand:+ start:7050 stop:7718 length:669 start_codon:yes stop_codon:yes gene_type:complete
MLNKTQLKTMLTLQDKMNKAVDKNWIELGRAWLRAAMVEGCEAVEHWGFKWWKAQNKNLEQLQMELVDIWHFALSDIIVKFGGDIDKSAQNVAELIAENVDVVTFDGKDYELSSLELLEKLDLMIGLAAAKRFSVPLFLTILTDCEMTSDELYRQYVGKNVLNIFRANNGYKSGTYVKIWDGQEDNEHLVKILNTLDTNDASFSDKLYQALENRYKPLTNHA